MVGFLHTYISRVKDSNLEPLCRESSARTNRPFVNCHLYNMYLVRITKQVGRIHGEKGLLGLAVSSWLFMTKIEVKTIQRRKTQRRKTQRRKLNAGKLNVANSTPENSTPR